MISINSRLGDTVGFGEIVGLEETLGAPVGTAEVVGYIVGEKLGCNPGRHWIFSSTLPAASQHPAILHLDVLSSKA
jgi:hypothetical protein